MGVLLFIPEKNNIHYAKEITCRTIKSENSIELIKRNKEACNIVIDFLMKIVSFFGRD